MIVIRNAKKNDALEHSTSLKRIQVTKQAPGEFITYPLVA